jgi:hypothetical protein
MNTIGPGLLVAALATRSSYWQPARRRSYAVMHWRFSGSPRCPL